MAKDNNRKAVISILQGFGFSAFEIPEESQKGRRADIRATKDTQSFLIEVKSRENHPEFMSRLKKANDLEIVSYEKQLHRSNSLGKIICDAVRQLEDTPDDVRSFKCIWFRALESLITDEFDFIKATLYGTRHLLVCDQSIIFSYVSCYYFDPNEFYKFRSLDAVVLENGKRVELCLNSLSCRFDEFRCSSLYRIFESKGTLRIIDPNKLEMGKEILVADTDVPRNDREAVIRFIQEKYGLHVQPIDMKVIGAGILYTQG